MSVEDPIKQKLHSFVREVVLDNTSSYAIREKALDLMLEIQGYAKAKFHTITLGYSKVDIAEAVYLEIDRFLEAQQKIQAIKTLRTYTNCSLKDGKDAVENVANFPHARPGYGY